jgi:hypothetical protein
MIFNHTSGQVTISGNTVYTGNGAGIQAINGDQAGRFYLRGNTLTQTANGGYAAIIRGVAVVQFAGNTLDNPYGSSISITQDAALNQVGELIWDTSNRVLAGATSFDWPHITKASGVLQGTASPVGAVVASEPGTLYRELTAGTTVLWTAQSADSAGWVPLASDTHAIHYGWYTATITSVADGGACSNSGNGCLHVVRTNGDVHDYPNSTVSGTGTTIQLTNASTNLWLSAVEKKTTTAFVLGGSLTALTAYNIGDGTSSVFYVANEVYDLVAAVADNNIQRLSCGGTTAGIWYSLSKCGGGTVGNNYVTILIKPTTDSMSKIAAGGVLQLRLLMGTVQ